MLLESLPARWHYASGFSKLHGINFEVATIDPEMEVVNGTNAWRIEVLDTTGSQKREYWVSPDYNWGVVRFRQSINGNISTEISCGFQSVSDQWILVDWRVTRYDPDHTPRSITETTVDLATFVTDIPKDKFKINFPVGSIVTDATVQITEDGRSRERLYFIRPDGTERDILWSERNLSYEEIAKSDTGEFLSIASGSFTFFRTFVFMTVLLTVLGGAFFLLARQHKKSP